jgi:5-(carboxyamino)imidazole ribonucleotide synthase
VASACKRNRELPDDCYGECIVEQGINFPAKCRWLARGHDGSTVFYPLTHNLHQDGILRTSVAFPQANAASRRRRKTCSRHHARAGLCRRDGDGVLYHPVRSADQRTGAARAQQRPLDAKRRVHQPVRAALRAITDLPLPPPVVNSPSVMINLIGTDLNYDWLKLPLVHLHWYDKEVRRVVKVT